MFTTSLGKDTVEVVPLADANPYFQMAFGNEFTFHGLALHTLVDWRKGGSVSDLTKQVFDEGGNSWDYDKPSPNPTIGKTLGAYRFNSWQNGNNASTYIQDGSYVKLREVTLTYAIPSRYSQRLLPGSRDARVSFSGRNLYTWTKYWSFDPEVNNFGNQPVVRFVDATRIRRHAASCSASTSGIRMRVMSKRLNRVRGRRRTRSRWRRAAIDWSCRTTRARPLRQSSPTPPRRSRSW